MNDVDELEQLLGKAQRQISRRGWLKTAIYAVCTLVGTGVGASKAAIALAAIVRQIATKDDVAALMAGQQEQIKTLLDGQRSHSDRIAAIEPLANGAAVCCVTQTNRVDHLYQLPMTVRTR